MIALNFFCEQSILEVLLKMILRKIHQNAELLDIIEVFCYSQQMRELIVRRVQKLISECIELRSSNSSNDLRSFKTLCIAGQSCRLFFYRLNILV